MRVRASIIIWVWGLVLLSSISLSAQELTLDNHLPYGRDSLIVYKLPYISATDTGTNCVWDFSELSIDSATTISADYFFPLSTDTTSIGLHREHSNKYFHVKNDTLWQTGYETSLTHMHYSYPIALFRFPFAYGDTINSILEGNGQYCHLIPLLVEGTNSTCIDAIGKLILPEDTFANTVRVHTLMQYQEKNNPQHKMREERYCWYSPYCRYPLLESVQAKNIRQTDTTSFAATYYTPQEPMTIPVREQAPLEQETAESSPDSLITNVSYLPNPVYTNLNIRYTLIRSAQVYISVHYNGGVMTFQTTPKQETEGEKIVYVNMSGMPTGAYAVYIHADDTIVSGNIIKL